MKNPATGGAVRVRLTRLEREGKTRAEMKDCFRKIFRAALLLGLAGTGDVGHAVVGTPVSCAIRAVSPEAVEIGWAAIPGERYLIETTDDLGADWTVDPYGPGVLLAATPDLTAEVAVAGDARFFRVLKLAGEPANPDPDYLIWHSYSTSQGV